MGKIDWCELLGWDEDQLEDIRYAAFAYIRQGKYDVAIPLFAALVVLDSSNAYDAQTLGALHLQLGNADQAVRYLDHALKLEGDHAATLLNLCKARFLQGKRAEGLKLCKMLLKEEGAISNVAEALQLAYS